MKSIDYASPPLAGEASMMSYADWLDFFQGVALLFSGEEEFDASSSQHTSASSSISFLEEDPMGSTFAENGSLFLESGPPGGKGAPARGGAPQLRKWAWHRALKGHLGQLAQSPILQTVTFGFVTLLLLTVCFGFWRKYIRPALFNVRPPPRGQRHLPVVEPDSPLERLPSNGSPMDRDPVTNGAEPNTQLPFQKSITGVLLYYIWIAFVVFMSTVVAMLILVYQFAPSEQEGFILALQKALLPCEAGGGATASSGEGEQALSVAADAERYIFYCKGWPSVRPDSVNAKLQMGFAFLYTWFVLAVILVFFYAGDLYWILALAEVSSLADADYVGFSEDVYEEDEGAFFLDKQQSSTARAETRRQVNKAMTSRNLQPISYVPVEQEATVSSTSLERELYKVYGVGVLDGVLDAGASEEEGGAGGGSGGLYSAAAPGETGSHMRMLDTAAASLGLITGGGAGSGEQMGTSRFFKFRCLRYVYNRSEGRFIPRKERIEHLSAQSIKGRFFSFTETTQNELGGMSVKPVGLGDLGYQRLQMLRSYFGNNVVEPHESKTFLQCFIQEVTGTFLYVFQILAALIFIFLEAGWVSMVYEMIYFTSAMLNAFYCWRAWRRILEMSRNNSTIRVFRKGPATNSKCAFFELNSEDLLPGDIIEIRDGMIVPCEVLLVHGNVMMDESQLTGESTPMSKEAVEGSGSRRALDFGKDKTHILFSGTEVIAVESTPITSDGYISSSSDASANSQQSVAMQKHFNRMDRAYAVVTAIGTGTSRGDLIRGMFYPLRLYFEFDAQMIKASSYMMCILPFFVVLIFCFTNPFADSDRFEAIVLVTATVFTSLPQFANPMIPTLQSRSCETSGRRLESKKVGCMEQEKIPQAGKVNLFCFDKTGTLTKEGMDFYGVCVNKGQLQANADGAAAFSSYRKGIRGTSKEGPGRGISSSPEAADALAKTHGSDLTALDDDALNQLDALATTQKSLNDAGSASSTEETEHLLRMRKLGSLVNGVDADPVVRSNFIEHAYETPEQFNRALATSGHDSVLFGLACCHSLSVQGGNSAVPSGSMAPPQQLGGGGAASGTSAASASQGTVVGNPLEQETVSKLGWRLNKTGQQGTTMRMEGSYDVEQRADILRKWKFDQGRQLQVVVTCVESVDNPNKQEATVYAKGSMEAVSRLILGGGGQSGKNDTEQMLASVSDLADVYSSRGFYVLGMCQAKIQLGSAGWDSLESMALDGVLNVCRFEYMGMLLFRNELRPDSVKVIRDLKRANVHTVMITGDNVYTGIAISKQVGLVEDCPFCIRTDEEGVPVWEEVSTSFGALVRAKKRGGASNALLSNALTDSPDSNGGASADQIAAPVKNNHDLEQLVRVLKERNLFSQRGVDFVSCAINEAALKKITSEPGYANLWHRLLPYIGVFGRVKPDGKRKIIRFFQDRSKNFVVAMAGDGGNDSGALKQAHVGVALVHSGNNKDKDDDDMSSAKQGTNVVAPFIATEDDITKVVEVLKEGRACLDTNISVFYSFTILGVSWVLCGKILMQARLAFGCLTQYATEECLMVLLMPLTYALQGTRDVLAPTTPDSTLAGRRSFIYIIGMIALNIAVCLTTWSILAFPPRETQKPNLDVRRVEDDYPSWYSPVVMAKDGYWNLGSIAGRSNNLDMAFVFLYFFAAAANVGLAQCNGGMRPPSDAGPDYRNTGQRSAQQDSAAGELVGEILDGGQGDDADFINGAGGARRKAPGGGLLRQPVAANVTGDIETGVPDSLSATANSSSNTDDDEELATFMAGGIRADHLRRRQNRAIGDGSAGRPMVGKAVTTGRLLSETDAAVLASEGLGETCCARFFMPPYKKHWTSNWSFVMIMLIVYPLVSLLLFSSGHYWNWFLDVNTYAHQQAGSLEDYFLYYHATNRKMRNIMQTETLELTGQDGKKVLALPSKLLPRPHKDDDAASTNAAAHIADASGAKLVKQTTSGGDKAREESEKEKAELKARENKALEAAGVVPNLVREPHTNCEEYLESVRKQNKETGNLEIAQSFLPEETGLPGAQGGTRSRYSGFGEGVCAIHIRISEGSATSKTAPKGAAAAPTGQEQPHGFFQDLGWLGKSKGQADSKEQQKWCEYMCAYSWNYRADRHAFSCKFALPWGRDCYMFQGNVDHFLHVPELPPAAANTSPKATASAGTTGANGGENRNVAPNNQGQAAAAAAPAAAAPAAAAPAAGAAAGAAAPVATSFVQHGQQLVDESFLEAAVVGGGNGPATPSRIEKAESTDHGQGAQKKLSTGDHAASDSEDVKALQSKQQQHQQKGATPRNPQLLSTMAQGKPKQLQILDRYHVFGLEKSGYQSYAFQGFFVMIIFVHMLLVTSYTKWLRS
ncbi:unnamed protein product [Amoebophrya sp. A25]|nr:unnamed protein product [Amoebophrya sp. A25]|eukprot:GSA25T00007485001.1